MKSRKCCTAMSQHTETSTSGTKNCTRRKNKTSAVTPTELSQCRWFAKFASIREVNRSRVRRLTRNATPARTETQTSKNTTWYNQETPTKPTVLYINTGATLSRSHVRTQRCRIQWAQRHHEGTPMTTSSNIGSSAKSHAHHLKLLCPNTPTTEVAPRQNSGTKSTPRHSHHHTQTKHTHTLTHRSRNIPWTPLFQRTQNERAQQTTAKCKLKNLQHKEQSNPQE